MIKLKQILISTEDSSKMKTSDDEAKDLTENLGKFLQDSVENPIKVLKSNPSNKSSIQKDTVFVVEARTE